MDKTKKAPLDGSRVKTDQSLEDERYRTDEVIELKSQSIEEESDEKTRLARIAADRNLASKRAVDDRDKSDRQPDAAELELLNERERSDEAQAQARVEEDRIREKERSQKRYVAEALLETERKLTDDNLLDERERTDVAHDHTKSQLITRGQFLAVVSHDLKNPLSAISMGAGLMRMVLSKSKSGGGEDGLLKYLEIIERNVACMDRMISDLLDVERMSNDRLFLTIQLCNVGDLLKECVDMFTPVAITKSCSLSIEPLGEPIFASIDRDKILQVLSNLVGNSLKFSPKGSTIRLSARRLQQEVEISVADNGPGIPDDKKAQIFERFSQLKLNDRRGLGLGLFISKWIVEAHKGRIWAKSEVGSGSTFTFTLPGASGAK